MIRKLGIILECDKGSADELVFTCLVRRLAPEVELTFRRLGNKKAVFLKGAEAAEALVSINKCDLVLVVWDLKPLWKEEDESVKDCKAECKILRTSFGSMSEETRAKIRLLCLSHELETWLLADAGALEEFFSKQTYKPKIPAIKKLGTRTDPKAVLDGLFKTHRGARYRYTDFTDAIKISQQWKSTSKLRKVQSFKRFLTLLMGDAKADFIKDATACKELGHKGAKQRAIRTNPPPSR